MNNTKHYLEVVGAHPAIAGWNDVSRDRLLVTLRRMLDPEHGSGLLTQANPQEVAIAIATVLFCQGLNWETAKTVAESAQVSQPTAIAPKEKKPAIKARKGITYSDGASKGNPGPAGIGAVILDDQGEVLSEVSAWIGSATNNVAEYRALLAALQKARELGLQELIVRADSELMIKQLLGSYKVRNVDLLPLYEEAKSLLKGFKAVKLEHVMREKNKRADELANEGVKSGATR